MRRVILLTTTALLLGACETLTGGHGLGPKATPVVVDAPVSPKPDWVAYAPDDLPQTDWVSEFGDSRLPELINEALEKNTDIRTAIARYDQALAQLKGAQADRLPTLNGGVNVSRSEPFGGGGVVTIPGGGQVSVGGGTTNLGLGLNASWEADVWGRIRDSVSSSELSASASSADVAATKLLIASRVSQTWFNIIEAKLLVDLSARDIQTLEGALRLTERRFQGGVTSSSDVRLARSSVANAKALEASRKQSLASQTRALEILLRRYPEGAIASTADLPTLPALSGAAQPGYILKRRPDLLAAERRMHAAGLNVDVARKNLYPRLSLSPTLNSSGSSLSTIFDVNNVIGNLAGNISQPIFQGGALRANVAGQDAVLRQQIEGYTDTLLDAYLEVENALDAEQHLATREASLRVALSESRAAEERLEQRYVEGLATILELLDAQSRQISSEAQLITARKDRLANRVALHVALGGGVFGEEVTKDVDEVVPPVLNFGKLNFLSQDE
ncbi:MAG: efflux transporter outer membrane subunit [Maricaulaceae bacterium]